MRSDWPLHADIGAGVVVGRPRSKTVQKAFLDEIDEYPTDLDGQGSPFEMIEARQESFLREGTWKRVKISTPTIKGASAIEAEYEASDKRRWHVRCPHCADEFVFEFGPHFHFDQEWPFRAWYSCPYCGAVVEESDRARMVRAGRWIATAPAPGRKPGFHFDALSSPFVPWSKIAERYVTAAGDPQRLKGFYNLTLGLPFEMKGDTPSHEILMLRREEGLKRGHIPPNGLILVGSADVQGAGIGTKSSRSRGRARLGLSTPVSLMEVRSRRTARRSSSSRSASSTGRGLTPGDGPESWTPWVWTPDSARSRSILGQAAAQRFNPLTRGAMSSWPSKAAMDGIDRPSGYPATSISISPASVCAMARRFAQSGPSASKRLS